MAENLSIDEKKIENPQKNDRIINKKINQEKPIKNTYRKRKNEIMDVFAESAKETKMDNTLPEVLLKCTIHDLVRSSRSSSGWVYKLFLLIIPNFTTFFVKYFH